MLASQYQQHPRDQLLQSMERIYRYRMTTTSGGNLSIREGNGDIWITPARVDKGALRAEDIVCVHPDGSLDGIRKPSSELPIHQEIRHRRPELVGIVHAHPSALVAFSLVHQVPNTRLFHQAWRVCGTPGFAPYELPGSPALGDRVADSFGEGFDCVILENHGVVTAGSSLAHAFNRFETLEFTARTLIRTHLLGGEPHFLTDDEISLERQRDSIMEDFSPQPPSRAEELARARLCEFVRRAYRQRLFISTQGSFSARVDDSSFLITPYQVDRGTVDPQDLVLIRAGRTEAGKMPSRATDIHAAIYHRHPATGAIINAYPVNATAFSVSGTILDCRTIPESYVVARHLGRAPFGLQFQDAEALAGLLSPAQPALILENDGVLVTGSDILEAFDRLEVVESTAEAIINTRAIGVLQPLSQSVTRGLDEAFFGIKS